jgi:hypothetical protein
MNIHYDVTTGPVAVSYEYSAGRRHYSLDARMIVTLYALVVPHPVWFTLSHMFLT